MICQACQEDKPEDNFLLRVDTGKVRPYCKECGKDIQRARYENHKRTAPFKHKAARTKSRASSLGVPCDITQEYLESIWTGVCPVYGVPVFISGKRGQDTTAELDRLDPTQGYIKGNVRFLSRRANRHKNDMTLEDVLKLKEWMERTCQKNR